MLYEQKAYRERRRDYWIEKPVNPHSGKVAVFPTGLELKRKLIVPTVK